jgi:hypothetical protein
MVVGGIERMQSSEKKQKAKSRKQKAIAADILADT